MEEGLDDTIQTAANSSQVVQLLLTGQAQFGQLSPESILLAAGKQPLPVKLIYPLIRKTIYTAALRPDSPVKNFGDLKGKAVGFPSSSTNLTIYANSRLAEFGLSLNDVKVVETGYGVTSMEALKNGTIDAFIAWPGLLAAYENAGYKLKLLPEADWQNQYYGIGLAATADYIKNNPDVVEKIGRGLAKTAVVLKAKPDAVIESFWKTYPTRAPMPMDDRQKSLAKEQNILRATAAQMRVNELPADFAWGSQDLATWERHLKLLTETKLVTEKLNPADYFVTDYVAKYNTFDRDAVVRGLK
jgi:NitT/TauT family transport system substrate-binding protein